MGAETVDYVKAARYLDGEFDEKADEQLRSDEWNAALELGQMLCEREALVTKLLDAAFAMADRCTVGNFGNRQNRLRACAKRVLEFGK
jgi:hypothetical protein